MNDVRPIARCTRCREELQLVRRHTSPIRLGTPVITDFYECPACDAEFAFSPATGKWRHWSA
jgi:uncharacterized protein with PIN domain